MFVYLELSLQRVGLAVAYRVIKWVKGRPYLYEQRSFRVGGQVRTESTYLGPASPAEVQVYSRTKQTKDRVATTLSESPEPYQVVVQPQ